MSRLTFLNKQCKTLKTWDKQNIFERQACNMSVLTYLYAKEASGLSLLSTKVERSKHQGKENE